MNALRCLYVFGCLLFCAPFSSAAALIVPNTTNVTVQTGEIITVDAIVGPITDLYAFQFDWRFDPTVLSPVSVTEGAFLTQGGPTSFIGGLFDNANGVIAGTADSLTGPIKGVTGSGRLATATFTAIASGSTTLSIVNEIALDSNLNPIPEPSVVMWLLAAFAVLGCFAMNRRGDLPSRSFGEADAHAPWQTRLRSAPR